jgi:hypothetical protein
MYLNTLFFQYISYLSLQYNHTAWDCGSTKCLPVDGSAKNSNVKVSSYTPWRRLGWEEVQLLLILNLSTRWGWVVSIMPQPRSTPRERTPGTHCTGSWAGPRASLDAKARGKILCLCRGSNPDRPVCSQTLYWLSYPGSLPTTVVVPKSATGGSASNIIKHATYEYGRTKVTKPVQI